MKAIYIVIGLLGFFFIIAGIIALCFVFLYQQPVTPVTPINSPGTDLDSLIDITGLPCCVVNGAVLDRTYVAQFNLVASATPVAYTVACAGFSPTGIQPDEKQYDTCLALTRPNTNGAVAAPIARKGTKLYYAYSTGQSGCEMTGSCPV